MTKPASRLITLIMLLQRQPNQKAADLADKLGVSVRTFHRYLGMLEEMGIPIYSERGPHGGFSLVRGYKMPPLIFTPEEAVTVVLGTSVVGELWGQLYAQAAQGALAKLENVLPDEQRKEVAWAKRSLVATGMHRANPAVLAPLLEIVRQAVHDHRQLKIEYQRSDQPAATERRIDPYALVHRSGWWYVVGFCHLRQALRLFRVDRIRQAVVCEELFVPPADFDVHGYLAGAFAEEAVVCARLQFTADAVSHIALGQLPGVAEVDHNDDGTVDVTMIASDLPSLASLVLSFATWVTVIEPPELRAMVREWAQATAALYGDDSSHLNKRNEQ